MKYNSSGTKQWTRLLGTASSDAGYGVAVDGSGNVYVTGTTEGALDGQTHSGGTYDTFLTKYNASGTKQWTRLLGNGTETYAYTVAVDGSSNIFVAGHTRGTFDSESNAGMLDIYVAKYNSSGTRQWVRMLGSARFDYCYGVGTDGSGNVYVAGAAYGDFDGLANSDPTWMSEDIFIAKFDTSGSKQWSRFFGTATNDVVSGLAVDASGNAYITGNSDGALDGETNAGGHDLYLIKYNTSGTKQWTRLLGTASGEYGRSVAVDGSGNSFLTGLTAGNLDGATNSGGNDAYLVKYDTSGNLQ
jgi:hypothetical protein